MTDFVLTPTNGKPHTAIDNGPQSREARIGKETHRIPLSRNEEGLSLDQVTRLFVSGELSAQRNVR